MCSSDLVMGSWGEGQIDLDRKSLVLLFLRMISCKGDEGGSTLLSPLEGTVCPVMRAILKELQ